LHPIRTRLTYANVTSTLALFLVLSGGAAFAASHLGRNSVGPRQLRANAVTGAKIRDGAVADADIAAGAVGRDQLAPRAVGADQLAAGAVSEDKLAPGAVGSGELGNGAVTDSKLAAGAVSGDKIAPGAVTADKIDAGSVPFSRIVQRIRGTAKVPFPTTTTTAYPLDNPTYTQPAGEDDQFLGQFVVTFGGGCGGRRSATAQLLLEQPERAGLQNPVIGSATIETETVGEVTKTVQFVPTANGPGTSALAPDAPTQRTFAVEMVRSHCDTGAGITMDGAQVDVIGTR
jgi:hypothetical protein